MSFEFKKKLVEKEVAGCKVWFRDLPLKTLMEFQKREDKYEAALNLLLLKLVDSEGNQAYTREQLDELDSDIVNELMIAASEKKVETT